MTTLTFPSIIPNSTEWSLQSNTQQHRSPLSGTIQTLELAGARWSASLRFDSLTQSDARTMMAFLVQLRGGAGRFYLYDHSLPVPRGTATGTPLVNGASQTGTSLTTDGWTINITGILKAGDYIGVNGELKMVTADCNSNGSGQCTVTFEPPLRSSPADNAAITVTRPTCTMMLTGDDQTKWSGNPGYRSSFVLTCVEPFS